MNISNDLIPYRKGDLWGYCDRDGNIVLEPRFRSVSHFKYGIAYFIEDDENRKGNWIDVGVLSSSLEVILEAGSRKLSILRRDLGDRNLNSCKELHFFENTFDAECTYYHKISERDSPRKSMFDFDLEVNSDLFLGFNRSSNNSISHIQLHDKGNKIIDPVFLPEKIDPRVSRLLLHIKVQLNIHSINEKCGHILESGIVSIPFIYDSLTYCENGVFIGNKGGKFSLISEAGNIITSSEYNRLEFNSYSNSWLGYLEEEISYITLDENLKEIVKGYDLDPYFKIVSHPKDEIVEKSQQKDSLRTSARFIGPRRKFEPFVKKEPKKFGINFRKERNDSNLSELYPPCFESAEVIDKLFVKVKINGLFGIIDYRGVFIIPNKFESIFYLGNNLFCIGLSSLWGMKYGVMSSEGQYKFDLNFKDGDFFEENKEIVLYETILEPRESRRLIDIYFQYDRKEKIFFGCIGYSGKKFWSGRCHHKFKINTDPKELWIDEEKNEPGIDYNDVTEYSDNPWNDVFGPGDEADEAFRNTRDE